MTADVTNKTTMIYSQNGCGSGAGFTKELFMLLQDIIYNFTLAKRFRLHTRTIIKRSRFLTYNNDTFEGANVVLIFDNSK